MKIVTVRTVAVALGLGLLAGCSNSQPTQPAPGGSEAQELMNKGKEQTMKERGGRGPGGGPPR
jgi:hypothetical protein